MPALVVRIRQ